MTLARTILLCATLAFSATASAARADLLAEGQDWREIPFDVVDQKPLLAARIGQTAGRMMFDTGTPEAVFLNRDAAVLPKGKVVGNGFAASGQAIEVQLHDAPEVQIGGLPFATGPAVVSGNFGFVEAMFGPDYLGFIGTPAVQDGAFVLDYQRRVLTVLHSDADGGAGRAATCGLGGGGSADLCPGPGRATHVRGLCRQPAGGAGFRHWRQWHLLSA